MKKKMFFTALIFLITCTFFGCKASTNIQSTSTTNNVNKPVTIDNVDDKYYKVVINYNSGISHKEMGVLLGKEIENKVPDFEKIADEDLAKMSSACGRSEEFNIDLAKKIMKNVNKAYVDELDGIASQLTGGSNDTLGDGKLSKDELYLLNLSADTLRPYSCSAASVYGSRTIDGKAIVGRELEWLSGSKNELNNISAVTIFKQGSKSLCSIGYVGFMGIISGFNINKVFASILDVYSVDPDGLDGIRSYPFDIRYSLENNNTLNGVAAFMSDKKHNYWRDHIIFLADSITGKVLENDIRSSGTNIRRGLRTDTSELNSDVVWGIKDAIATVNTFVLNGNYDAMGRGNSERWDSYKRLISENKSPISFEDMKSIMSFTNLQNGAPGYQADGSIYNNASVQDIVFKPQDMKLEVAFAPRNKDLPPKPDFVSIPITFK